MKVVRLQAENVKKITCVDITPSSDVVEISGKNGSGKTTVLDAIEWGLGGAENIQSMPIKNGERSARIKLDLGDIIVTRRFTEKGTSVTVENAEGARYPSPQAMLDQLCASISFDPLAFSRMKPRDQYEELRRIAGVTIDLDALDRANDADYRQRADLNKQAKTKAAQAQAFEFTYEAMAKPIDTTEIAAQMASAAKANQDRSAEENRRLRVTRQINTLNTEIATLEEQLAAKQAEAKAKIDERAAWSELAPDQDLAEFKEQIDDANKRNADHERRRLLDAILSDVSLLEAKADELTDGMDARNKEKSDAIAAADMPIDGISLGSGIVLFNGVPFDQASSGERLRTGVAIAMAGNPKLRVCLIRDASLLDEDGLKIVTDMARERDFQVWIETVDSSGKVGIVLEDGAVVGAETHVTPTNVASADTGFPDPYPNGKVTVVPVPIGATASATVPKPKAKRKSLAEKLGKTPEVKADAGTTPVGPLDGLDVPTTTETGAEIGVEDDEPWIVTRN